MLHKFRGMFGPGEAGGSGRQQVDLDDAWTLPRRSQRSKRTFGEKTDEGKGSGDPRKRARTDKETAPARTLAPSPGSATGAHLWLSGRTELYISGRVWKIRKLAAKLKLKAGQAVCWPVVLSARVGENRLAHCEHAGQPGHENIDGTAHKIAGFRASAIIEDESLWRYPTEEERETLRERRAQAPVVPARRPGVPDRGAAREARRGAPRQARGGQDFPPPSPPQVEEVTA